MNDRKINRGIELPRSLIVSDYQEKKRKMRKDDENPNLTDSKAKPIYPKIVGNAGEGAGRSATDLQKQRGISMNNYKLIIQNNSMEYGCVCVFQDHINSGVMPVAWFVKAAHPTTKVYCKWTTNYSFVWGEMESQRPGSEFEAAQMWDADPSGMNRIVFSKLNDAYTFKDLSAGAPTGSFEIMQDSAIPPSNQAFVGIAMSGSPIFVKQAQPNLNLAFSMPSEYWITFGNYRYGEVLRVEEIMNRGKIRFESGVYVMSVTLNQDNTWTISPVESDIRAEHSENGFSTES